MSKDRFIFNGDMFGAYVKIPTGLSKDMYIYKVIGRIESNRYCDVPIMGGMKSSLHSEIVPVLNVVHCGLSEDTVIRVALSDCEIVQPLNNPLTMEELREMEGKPVPVWCDKVNGYVFIALTKTEPYNQVWFLNHKGRCDMVLYYRTNFYLYKSEKEMSVSPKTQDKLVWFEEKNGNPLSGFDYNYGWKCSRCGFVLPIDYDDPDCKPNIKYCQNCGAKLSE